MLENTTIDYRFTKVTNRCYKFHAKPAKWQEAFRICSNEGANLAIINSEQEAELFVVLFKKYPIGSLRGTFNKHILHLGFSDLVNTDNYKTVNGEIFFIYFISFN